MRVCGTNIWGPPKNRAAAHVVLRKAYDLGLNFFDTADSYGPHVDEELIAEALHPYPKDLVIATKGGLLRPRPGAWDPDGRPEHLKRAIDGSLKRLKLERIDLYQLQRIGNTNDLRQRSPPRGPRPRDIRCQTRTLAAQEPTAQRTLAGCSRVERADPGERHAKPDIPPASDRLRTDRSSLMAPRGVRRAPRADRIGTRRCRAPVARGRGSTLRRADLPVREDPPD
jgi:hypothetical protein